MLSVPTRPAMLDRSRSPAITLHGVVSGANIEVVPLPDESQIVTLGMQASTNKFPILGYPSREPLSTCHFFPPVCPSRRLLVARFGKHSSITYKECQAICQSTCVIPLPAHVAFPPSGHKRYSSPNQPLVWSPKGMLPRIEQVGTSQDGWTTRRRDILSIRLSINTPHIRPENHRLAAEGGATPPCAPYAQSMRFHIVYGVASECSAP